MTNRFDPTIILKVAQVLNSKDSKLSDLLEMPGGIGVIGEGDYVFTKLYVLVLITVFHYVFKKL